jgi:hypothetical protein
MRKISPFFAMLLFCFLFPCLVKAQGPGQDKDPGVKDTLAVDRIAKVGSNEKVKVNVWLWRDEAIDSLVIPLTFWDAGNHDIFCDSVTFDKVVGGSNGFDVDNVAKKVLLWAKEIDEPHAVPIRRDTLATIYFHTGLSWNPDINVPIDTTTFETKATYNLKFFQLGFGPSPSPIEWIPIFFEGTLEVEQVPGANTLEDYALFQNYPNPFNTATTIRFSIPDISQVNLEVYNILGQRIKTLLENTSMSKGAYKVDWNGRDETGRMSSSGIYFYRLTILAKDVEKSAISKVGRMVFLK